MAALNPEHLLDQAERLIAAPPAGPPRQVDLRRAVSSAYYAVFHFVLTALADEVAGRTQRGTPRYELVYRSVDHRQFYSLCDELRKSSPKQKLLPYLTARGPGVNMQAFAAAAVDLQQQRHRADYNPTPRFRTSEVQLIISTARGALTRFQRLTAPRRKAFLTLLLCPPR